jgi:hypothetical protein
MTNVVQLAAPKNPALPEEVREVIEKAARKATAIHWAVVGL